MNKEELARWRIGQIQRGLVDASMSANEASEKIGRCRSYVGTILNGKSTSPGVDDMVFLSRLLGVNLIGPEYLDNFHIINNVLLKYMIKESETSPARAVPTVGLLEAGAYRERDDLSASTATANLPRDIRFPAARQYAFGVRCDSMNLAGLIEPGLVRVIEFRDAGVTLCPGMIVVIERRLPGTTLVEYSALQVEFAADGFALMPRSTNPKHTPTRIDAPASLDDPDAAIAIVGFVTLFFHEVEC